MASCALPSPMAATLGLHPFAVRPRLRNLPIPRLGSSRLSSLSRSSVSVHPPRSNRFRNARVRSSSSEDCRDASSFGEAQEAVAEILRECGASEEDSVRIASSSPSYVEMLVGNVLELDELSLWSSWNREIIEENVDINSLSFRKKVYYMARSKGDGGMLPYLESIGLKLSSALLIARYLSSETLPVLIDKVNFMRQILFSSGTNKVLTGRNARRMMMYLSVPADEDVQRTLSFFEKMEARQGGLNMLGEHASFPYLIESFPKLLLCSVENHLKPLVGFLELVGVPQGGISNLVLSFPPIILYDIDKDIKPKLRAFAKAGVEEKDMGKMLFKYPWILSTSVWGNYNEILAYFNEKKVPKSSVDLAIKSWPHILGCSTIKMKSMVEQFTEFGDNKKMLISIITSSPQLLLKKKEFLEVVSFLEEFGFHRKTIGRILNRCPRIFASNVDRTLRRKVNFLVDFGISKDCLLRVLRKYPELLLLDTNNTLLPRMSFLLTVGLSKREVCSMICRFSPILGYSIEVVLKPKLDFLLSTMKKPLKEIVEYPRYFSYSLDKKIKPRFWVLKNRKIDCSLKDMLSKNDENFVQEYMGIERLLVVPSSKDGSQSNM